MKNLTSRKILLGVGLLGATALAGLSTPASADPGQRRDFRDDRRYNAPVYLDRPAYGRPVPRNDAFRSLEGIVSKDTPGNDFNLRTNSGQQVRVYVQSGEPGAISRGDFVRLNGYFSNGVFYAQRINIIRNR